MRFLAISGSLRAASTNSAMLRVLRDLAPAGITIEIFDGLGDLPIFSPDREGDSAPAAVIAFKAAVAACDGLIIASPEYVRTLPGGLKNAIDWLVSGDELIAKPAAILHASYRGDDMLETLRAVLATVTTRFATDIFLRLPLMKLTPEEVATIMNAPEGRAKITGFIDSFAQFCRGNDRP
ncbi:NADPH-dependent FMN reductase [Oryzibacter oryziterrae]|uniref:NADPH-dependent FMN reductase n=1 Tax=Oryzibacter oryziterrae TaxID=2766474 RepID=UPI001F2FE96E|nr:NADPH-dependent FMN reductase [Oryzibacter oryziterrae]